MKTPFAIVVLMLTLASGWRFAAAQTTFLPAPESRIRIEGTSTLDAFTCETAEVVGEGEIGRTDKVAAMPVAELKASVHSFDCGKARMNRDMRAALKADEFPEIAFEVSDVRILEPSGNGITLRVAGRLTIAGAERDVELDVEGSRLADGRVRAYGEVGLRMTDFGIQPPTALFGLVRAHDPIKVSFDLYGVPEPSPSMAGNGGATAN